ncbi:MAG TPA: DUF697 domain-containing protein [Pirellulales bacterium]|nr:DUF697 domain-containing protein [Pirellulales bacterium]
MLGRFVDVKPMSDEEFARQRAKILTDVPVPAFWLFGKTGSGKTSIVRYLTGETDAAIGNGFRPETRQSRQYEFPAADSPLLRFFDTRGLGEHEYDPADDIQRLDESAHVMIVTARASDHALAELIGPLQQIRKSRPDRPVVLALTWLHEFYPQQQHPHPDPFDKNSEEFDKNSEEEVPAELHRSLQQQHQQFSHLVDRIVPVDFTRPEEGFDAPYFGGERLKTALIDFLPAAYRSALMQLDQAMQSLHDLNSRRAMPYILGYSSMAAAAAAAPVIWVDIPAVLAIQSRMVSRLAGVYDQSFDKQTLLTMTTAVGGRILARLALRGPLKLVPWLGMTANAAMAFAYTYALGKACCWYFGQIQKGNVPSAAELERVWSEQLTTASSLWSRQREEPQPS